MSVVWQRMKCRHNIFNETGSRWRTRARSQPSHRHSISTACTHAHASLARGAWCGCQWSELSLARPPIANLPPPTGAPPPSVGEAGCVSKS